MAAKSPPFLKSNTTSSVSSSAGVVSIDLNTCTDRLTLSLTENVVSWSISNLPPAGAYRDITVSFTQHASAAKTVSWTGLGSPVKFAGGTLNVPVVLSAQRTAVFRFFSDGTVHVFYGAVFQ